MINIKSTLLLLCVLFINASDILQAQEINYFPLEPHTEIFHYKNTTNYSVEEFLQEKTLFDDKEYVAIIKDCTSEKLIYSYFRKDKGAIYYYDTITNSESLIIPEILKKGHTWKSIDGNWKYKIVSINSKIVTPTDSYTDLLEIDAIQLKNLDKNKDKRYTLFFKNNVGKIASVIKGRLSHYRVEKKY